MERALSDAAMPSNARLLLSLRRALQDANENTDNADARYALTMANVVVDELMLRDDADFYARSAARGDELVASLPEALRSPGSQANNNRTSTLPPLARIANARARFAALIADHRDVFEAEPNQFLLGVLAWEDELYARALTYQAPKAEPAIVPLTREGLQNYLRTKFPERGDLEVTEFSPLIGGFQKRTVVFTARDSQNGSQSLVLRGEQPDKFIDLDLGEITDEFAAVSCAFAAGLRVAEPLWLEADASKLGFRFLVSRKVPGSNVGTAIGSGSGMSPTVVRSLMENLAQLHRVPLVSFAQRLGGRRVARWLAFKTLRDNTLANIHYNHDHLRRFLSPASPLTEYVFRWMVANVPPDEGPACLVHCDYAAHNILIDQGQVSGILDWESARFGDPAEDLAYFLQSAAAQIDRRQAIAWYEAAGGEHFSEYRLRFYEVLSSFRVAIACQLAAGMLEADSRARNEWLYLAVKWMHAGTGPILQRIAAAEQARR